MGRIFLHSLVTLLVVTWTTLVHAQDDDYYAPPQKETKPFKKEEAKKLMDRSPNKLYGPKLGIEAHAYLTYSGFSASLPLMGFFDKATGGVAFDGGLGLRLRVRKRFAFSLGFRYSIRQFSIQYEVTGLLPNGQMLPLTVNEDVAMFMPGFYIRPQWELGKRFYLGPQIQFNAIGINKINRNVTSSLGPVQLNPDRSPAIHSYSVQLDVGVHAGVKLHVADQLIIKPGVELGVGLAPAFVVQDDNGQNYSGGRFFCLRLGAVFEFGVWFDKATPIN